MPPPYVYVPAPQGPQTVIVQSPPPGPQTVLVREEVIVSEAEPVTVYMSGGTAIFNGVECPYEPVSCDLVRGQVRPIRFTRVGYPREFVMVEVFLSNDGGTFIYDYGSPNSCVVTNDGSWRSGRRYQAPHLGQRDWRSRTSGVSFEISYNSRSPDRRPGGPGEGPHDGGRPGNSGGPHNPDIGSNHGGNGPGGNGPGPGGNSGGPRNPGGNPAPGGNPGPNHPGGPVVAEKPARPMPERNPGLARNPEGLESAHNQPTGRPQPAAPTPTPVGE